MVASPRSGGLHGEESLTAGTGPDLIPGALVLALGSCEQAFVSFTETSSEYTETD